MEVMKIKNNQETLNTEPTLHLASLGLKLTTVTQKNKILEKLMLTSSQIKTKVTS